jgi:AraC-like DNA-binding protein
MAETDIAKLPRTEFRAAGYAPSNRYEVFRESIGCVFDIDKCAKSGAEFDASMETYLVGECMMVRTETAGHAWSRPASKIARDGIDHFMIQFFLDGSNDVRTGGHGLVDRRSLLAIDTAQPYEAVTSDFANVTLVIPRPLLAQSLSNPDEHGAHVLTGSEPLARMAYDGVRSLWANCPELSPADALSALEPTLDLLAAAMNGGLSDTPRDRHAVEWTLREKIRSYISEELHDPGLCPATLEGHFRLRRTKLYELFQDQGGIARIIRHERLERAMRMLIGVPARLSITEVGFRCGFSDSTGFGRAFKRRFGMTPSDARHAGPQLVYEHGGRIEATDRLWENWFRNL